MGWRDARAGRALVAEGRALGRAVGAEAGVLAANLSARGPRHGRNTGREGCATSHGAGGLRHGDLCPGGKLRSALLAELLVVEHRVADETGREGRAVSEGLGGGKVVAEAKDEAVRAVVGGGAEEAGHNYPGGNGATDR